MAAGLCREGNCWRRGGPAPFGGASSRAHPGPSSRLPSTASPVGSLPLPRGPGETAEPEPRYGFKSSSHVHCVTWGKSVLLSEPQFSHLYNGELVLDRRFQTADCTCVCAVSSTD